MEQHDREELAEVNAARKGFYEFLASMYKLELTDEQIGTLTKQDLPTDAEYVGAGYATVKEYLRHRDSGDVYKRQPLLIHYWWRSSPIHILACRTFSRTTDVFRPSVAP